MHGAPLGGHKIQPPGGRRRRIWGVRQLPRTPFATQGRSPQGSQIPQDIGQLMDVDGLLASGQKELDGTG